MSPPPLTVCKQTVARCLAGHACMPEKGATDGAYDTRKCNDAIAERGAAAVIPPRKNAHIWKHGNTKAERLKRDENLRSIRKHGRAAIHWARVRLRARSLRAALQSCV